MYPLKLRIFKKNEWTLRLDIKFAGYPEKLFQIWKGQISLCMKIKTKRVWFDFSLQFSIYIFKRKTQSKNILLILDDLVLRTLGLRLEYSLQFPMLSPHQGARIRSWFEIRMKMLTQSYHVFSIQNVFSSALRLRIRIDEIRWSGCSDSIKYY